MKQFVFGAMILETCKMNYEHGADHFYLNELNTELVIFQCESVICNLQIKHVKTETKRRTGTRSCMMKTIQKKLDKNQEVKHNQRLN